MREVRQAFVGGGSNLGDRGATLRAAADALRKCPGILSVLRSSFYETDPVGGVEQPRFINVVFAIDTELAPEALLHELQRIEHEFGRVRRERWGARTLDLDLLYYRGETRATTELTLPHPRMFERAFVIVPLRELLAKPALRATAPIDFVRAVETVRVDERGVTLEETVK